MKSIVIYQQKGGNHKTSVSLTLAVLLAEIKKGNKIAIIDCDDQGNLTSWATGKDHSLIKYEFADVLEEVCGIDKALVKFDQFDLLGTVPATRKINTYEAGRLTSEQNIMLDIKDFFADEGYDFIIWDCGPDFKMLNKSIMKQADVIVSPLVPEYFATIGLESLYKSIDYLRDANKRMKGVNIPDPIIVLSGVNKTHSDHKGNLADMRKANITITATIPVDPIFKKAQMAGETIFDVVGYKPKRETVKAYLKIIKKVVA